MVTPHPFHQQAPSQPLQYQVPPITRYGCVCVCVCVCLNVCVCVCVCVSVPCPISHFHLRSSCSNIRWTKHLPRMRNVRVVCDAVVMINVVRHVTEQETFQAGYRKGGS